ncbi:cell wall-binding repeat-containing protein [Clostridium sp. OS1-26]|uniref:cell wall-binding repeat-containing protein n=1 Tax=Clostridium sp. OS1-26 TaxID=3070681 RepID=UPI0027E1F213|nr:cell wall-binding repeat-containing protein [Clostridium sp. OS1-26]WML32609.1 cell wall-binding repeat-containing protein [Clostridium sp. OS1-26]
MSKKFKLALCLATLILMMLLSTTVFASSTTRLFGQDRYETSSKIALNGWAHSDYAILASGEDYPDALSATPLAGKYKAPILLTQKNTIPASTLSTIQQLEVKNIIIIGGVAVISSSVENQLTSSGIRVTRLAGKDRYDTNIKVVEQLGSVSQIVVVTGEDFADALSIAPIAVKNNMPIILVPNDSIPEKVKNYISTQNISRTYVIGKGNSILDETGLPYVTKINGSNKYQRNLACISYFKKGLDFGTIYLASGENFADGLSGSILAGTNGNPLFLVGSDVTNEKNLLQLVAPNANIKIFGGTGVVPNSTVDNFDSTENTTTSGAINTTTSSAIDTTTSAAIGVSTDLQTPTRLSVVEVTNNSISIQWTQTAEEDYYIYYSTDNVNFKAVRDDNGNKIKFPWRPYCSLKLMKIPDNTTVYFKIAAVKNGIQSQFSNIVKASTQNLVQRKVDRWQQVGSIEITSTQIKCSNDGRVGYLTYTVTDINGYDITNSNVQLDVRSSIGSASYNNGIITIIFPDDVEFKTIPSVKVEIYGFRDLDHGVTAYGAATLSTAAQDYIVSFSPINP